MSKKQNVLSNGWYVDHDEFLAKGYEARIYRVVENRWFDLDGTPTEKPLVPWPLRLVQR